MTDDIAVLGAAGSEDDGVLGDTQKPPPKKLKGTSFRQEIQ